MRRKLLSLLLVLCMVVGLFQTAGIVAVKAAPADMSDLAAQAVRNSYRLYRGGRAVDAGYGNFGAYEAYVLTRAGADLETWERDGTNLKAEVMVLIDDTIASPDGKSAKRIAQEYLAAKEWGETAKATDLLAILNTRQTASEDGSFDSNGFSDLPAFEALGRAGDIGEIDTAGAITYILSIRDGETGAWTSTWNDFTATAQAVRALGYLKPYAGEQTVAVQAAMDAGLAWMKGTQQPDGSLKNGDWDDPAVDTSEAIYTLDLLDIDPDEWESAEGNTPVDYMEDGAFNDADNTFGSSKNLVDDIWVLDAYLKLGAAVPADTVLGIAVTPSGVRIEKGESLQHTATVSEFVYGEKDVSTVASWWTGDEDIATVSGNGLVTGVGAGETDVTAFYGGCSGTVTVIVEGGSGGPVSPTERAQLYIRGYEGVILPKTWFDTERNDTVLSFTLKALDDRGIPYRESGGYISSIDGQSEKDKGAKSGWLFRVNRNFEKFATEAADAVPVNEDDLIEWRYTTDLGEDIGWVDSSGNFSRYYDTESKDTGEIIKEAKKVLKDKKASEQDIDEAIDSLVSVMVDDPDNQEAYDVIRVLTQKAIEKAGRIELGSSKLQRDGQRVAAHIGKGMLPDAAGKVLKKIEDLKDKLERNNIRIVWDLEKKVAVEIPAGGEEEVAAILPAGVLEAVFEEGIDKLEIKTEAASFGITPGTFDGHTMGERIELIARKVEKDQLPDNVAGIPEGSLVVDLGLSVGNQETATFRRPVEISIPYTGPAKEDDSITVFLLKDDGTSEAVGGIYDPVTQTVRFLTSHFSRYFAKPFVKKFNDMDSYGWAEEAVSIMAGKGFISGRNDELFDPGANITRAEFAAIIARMLKYETPDSTELPFIDVSEDNWYFNAVAAAYRNGLINGRSGQVFDSDGNITRQEMAVIIANVLKMKSYRQKGKAELDAFDDKGNISDWAENAVALSVNLGILKGMDDGNFCPLQNANRAQAAVVLNKLYKVFMD
ncbi:MAG: S-layer homology domain-containing protein [Firmicutes bacterium]|nr:S-layer homology domain-containing protein [Bacillota bacterium]